MIAYRFECLPCILGWLVDLRWYLRWVNHFVHQSNLLWQKSSHLSNVIVFRGENLLKFSFPDDEKRKLMVWKRQSSENDSTVIWNLMSTLKSFYSLPHFVQYFFKCSFQYFENHPFSHLLVQPQNHGVWREWREWRDVTVFRCQEMEGKKISWISYHLQPLTIISLFNSMVSYVERA